MSMIRDLKMELTIGHSFIRVPQIDVLSGRPDREIRIAIRAILTYYSHEAGTELLIDQQGYVITPLSMDAIDRLIFAAGGKVEEL